MTVTETPDTVAPSVDWEIGWQELHTDEPARRSGPDPLVVAAAAAVIGVLVAKVIDWRAHAHPRG
jgi:hypothetical protein